MRAGGRPRRWRGRTVNYIPQIAGRLRANMFFVYIIKSLKDGSFYIGQTNDFEDRLRRHNGGHCKFTKSRAPYELVRIEEFSTRNEAMIRERQIKSWKGGKSLKNLVN